MDIQIMCAMGPPGTFSEWLLRLKLTLAVSKEIVGERETQLDNLSYSVLCMYFLCVYIVT